MKNTTIKQNPIADFTTVDTEDRKNLNLRAGDTVKVWIKIVEEGKGKSKEKKVRLQPFEGLVIARKHGSEAGATFTVRRTSDGIGVEKIFPLFSPVIDKIEILKRGSVRRSKLYVIREKTTKSAKRILRKSEIVSISSKSDIEEAKRKELEKKAAEEEAKKAEEAKRVAEEEAKKAEESDKTTEENSTEEKKD